MSLQLVVEGQIESLLLKRARLQSVLVQAYMTSFDVTDGHKCKRRDKSRIRAVFVNQNLMFGWSLEIDCLMN